MGSPNGILPACRNGISGRKAGILTNKFMKLDKINKLQEKLDRIRKFLSETTEPFDDWDYDGKELKIFLNDELIEEYSKRDLKEIIKLD